MNITNYLALLLIAKSATAFWDMGSTTIDPALWRWDAATVRQSRFRWQITQSTSYGMWFRWWDWDEIEFRRRLYVIAGITIDFINLTTGAILNRRTILTSSNPLDPYMTRQKKLRIWALGRTGNNNTPWRYRVWRVTRIFPKSLNPEHCHGPFCHHQPRHDVSIVHSLDQMYVYYADMHYRYHYPIRTTLTTKKKVLDSGILWFAGSGYEYPQHIQENYKIFYARTDRAFVVDCSKYLPKWWGKFICFKNYEDLPGIQNGGPLFDDNIVVGIGCFEIRYNDDRVLVFTDLRYYVDWINHYGYVWAGEYYEYAYPQWSVYTGWFSDSGGNYPIIPTYQIKEYGMYPLG